jgi:hypothetical protein
LLDAPAHIMRHDSLACERVQPEISGIGTKGGVESAGGGI